MPYKCVLPWIHVLLLLMCSNPVSLAIFKFTNVKCEDHDLAFARFEKCKLIVPRRGVISLNIHLALLQSPVTNATINMALYKRANGYQPYLFNKSADVCGFFAHRNKYPVFHVIFSIFVKNSNLNHTCPYYDSIEVNDLVLEEKMFQLLPLPNGQYLFKLMFYAYNELKAAVQVVVTRSD